MTRVLQWYSVNGVGPLDLWGFLGSLVNVCALASTRAFGQCRATKVAGIFQGKKEYTPPPWHPSFFGLSPDPEATEQKKLWCIPFSLENKGKGYTP